MLPILVTLQYVADAKNSVLDRLSREEKGATAVEYGLLIALVAIVIVGAMAALGSANGPIKNLIDGISTKLTIS
jgi:pilus assembly protein Flp/PilA